MKKKDKKMYIVKWENKLNGTVGCSQRFTKEKADQLCANANKEFKNVKHWVKLVGGTHAETN